MFNTKFRVVFAVVAAVAFSVFAETKFATIDLEKIVKLHPNTEADKKLLEKTLQEYTSQADAAEAAALAARKALEAAANEVRNPALSEKARKTAEADAKAKYEAARTAEQTLVETKRNLQRRLTEQEVMMLKCTIDEIEDVIAKYAKEKGLSAVVPTTGAKLGVTPAFIWSDPALDITADIMKIMKIEDKVVEDKAKAEAKQ